MQRLIICLTLAGSDQPLARQPDWPGLFCEIGSKD